MGPYIAYIITLAVGVICLIIGRINLKGDISTLHSYHRKRVSEEDRLPFGKLIGRGMFSIGTAIILYSALSVITVITSIAAYTYIGMALLLAGLVGGIGILLYATKKYNKGIF